MKPRNEPDRNKATFQTDETSGDQLGRVSSKPRRPSVRQERDLLFHIIECLPGVFYLFDKDGRHLMWNKHLEEVSGYDTAEMREIRPLDLFSNEEKSLVAERIREVFHVGFADVEAHFLTKAGRRIPYYFNGTLIRIDGEPHLIGMGLDISEQKRHERELQNANYLLEMVLNNIPQGVFWKDLNSIYLGCNDLVGKMAGFHEPTEVVGKSDYELPGITKEQAESYIQKDREIMATGASQSGIVYTSRHPDGRQIWLETTKVPLRDPRGQIVGVLGTWTDITEKRRLEEQLRQSQKMEAFGQLAAGVAHDFNNLLTVITGYSDILLKNLAEDDPRRGAALSIGNAAGRAAALTSQLLAFSRLTVLEPRVTNLNRIVVEMEPILQRLIGEDILLSIKCAEDLWAVKVDQGQIGQVLLNLVINARDAMPEGGALSIATQNYLLGEDSGDLMPGNYVILMVSDSGSGIPEGYLGRIFEPFFTTKGPGKGTGLGLAVVHGIVKQSGGGIEVESTADSGSTFKVYLPAVGAETSLSVEEKVEPVSSEGSETILLVDDEDAVRAFTRLVLEDHGYTVIEAASGSEAFEIANSMGEHIDLLVTDVVMPDIDGPKLADELSARLPKLRILFISGYAGETSVRQSVLRDGAALLQKPFTPVVLAAKVRQVLDSDPKSRNSDDRHISITEP